MELHFFLFQRTSRWSLYFSFFFCQDDEPFISNWFAVILIGTRMVIIVTNLMRISMLDFFLPFFVVLDLYVD